MLVRCAGAIVLDSDRLLVILRGRPPSAGLWSVPGGRVEPGETDEEAVVREVFEETGLAVRAGRLVGSVERPGAGGVTYQIFDYAAVLAPGADPEALRPGDDAADARWADAALLRALPMAPGVLDALAGWGIWDPECYRLSDDYRSEPTP